MRRMDPTLETEPQQENPQQQPTLGERTYTTVGRAMTFVMKTMIPGAWQAVVQMLADTLPSHIQLKEAAFLDWAQIEVHTEWVEELRDQGFVDAGLYHANPMCNNLHLLVNEAYDLRAIIYEHANAGIVLDLVTLYCDGTGMTFVNRPSPGYEQPPLHPNIYLGPVRVWELLDTCLRDRPDKPRFPVSRASARRLMELEYEFGAKRLRGESLNPVEIAESYAEVVQVYAVKQPRGSKTTSKARAAAQNAPVTDAVQPVSGKQYEAVEEETSPVASVATETEVVVTPNPLATIGWRAPAQPPQPADAPEPVESEEQPAPEVTSDPQDERGQLALPFLKFGKRK